MFNGRFDPIFYAGIGLAVQALLAVILRFLSKSFTEVKHTADDWWILLSVIILCISGGVMIWGNAGHETASSNRADSVNYYEALLVISCLYSVLTTTIKISILILYRRIFSTHMFRRVSLSVGIVVLLWGIAGTVSSALTCLPPEHFWLDVPGFCFNFNPYFLSYGIIETIIDVVILVLPVRMISTLQMSLPKKITLSGIFLLGGFVVITGILRLYYGHKPGVHFENVQLWSLIHVCTAISCACLPTYRPLLAKMANFSSSIWQRYGTVFTAHTLTNNSRKNGDSTEQGKLHIIHITHNEMCDPREDLARLTQITGGLSDAKSLDNYMQHTGHSLNQIAVRRTVEIV